MLSAQLVRFYNAKMDKAGTGKRNEGAIGRTWGR